jgi:hypothetical protein
VSALELLTASFAAGIGLGAVVRLVVVAVHRK